VSARTGESEDFGQKRQPPDVAERSDRVQDLRRDTDRFAGRHAQSHRPRLGLDAHVHGDRRQRQRWLAAAAGRVHGQRPRAQAHR